MQNQYQVKDATLTVILPKELDHPAADEIREETDKIMSRCYIHTIIFNFQNTAFMDSSGVGMIMGRYKALGMGNDCIKVKAASPYIGKILRLSGLHQVVQIEK